jgi:hypothetical protein
LHPSFIDEYLKDGVVRPALTIRGVRLFSLNRVKRQLRAWLARIEPSSRVSAREIECDVLHGILDESPEV